jgi:hypothetical protein
MGIFKKVTLFVLINVKATATSVTSCSVSGSICGRSVNGSR